jgi:hypothetical protein
MKDLKKKLEDIISEEIFYKSNSKPVFSEL